MDKGSGEMKLDAHKASGQMGVEKVDSAMSRQDKAAIRALQFNALNMTEERGFVEEEWRNIDEAYAMEGGPGKMYTLKEDGKIVAAIGLTKEEGAYRVTEFHLAEDTGAQELIQTLMRSVAEDLLQKGVQHLYVEAPAPLDEFERYCSLFGKHEGGRIEIELLRATEL